jgi:tRNA(Ile)-lysidine synthase
MYSNRKYWLACSGGLDSVVLAHILTLNHVNFGIVHCNFKLRGSESDQDEKFVIELAKKLSVPCETKVIKIDASKNTQLSAREKRYEWFNKIIQAKSKVILAHHKDDQEETFWIQLERGAGVAGLVGMTSHHKGFIRPLLSYSKEEILELAQQNNWIWKEDQSNSSIKYKRNFYRLSLIPALREAGIENHTVNEIVANYQVLFNHLKKQVLWSSPLKISDWERCPILLRHEILRRKNISIHFEAEITKLCRSQKGAKIKVHPYHVWNNGDTLHFSSAYTDTPLPKISVKTIPFSTVDFSKKQVFYFDANKLRGNIMVRNWKAGDYFHPLGMNGKKTISDYLTDKKIDASEKRNILILEDDEKIVAVCGFAPSELVKIDAKTEAIVVVEW